MLGELFREDYPRDSLSCKTGVFKYTRCISPNNYRRDTPTGEENNIPVA